MQASLTHFARRRPGTLVCSGLALFAVAWLAELTWSALTPPFDNLEQLAWAQSLQAGYYKHPPLPTWIAWLPVRLTSGSAWSGYLLGAACTLGSAYLLWRLLAHTRGRRHATIALLAGLCITYYTARLNYYNHDIVLLLVHTLSAVVAWRAVSSANRRWWIALGAVLGAGALTKYQVSVTIACVIAYWLSCGGWRKAAQRRGLFIAALVAAALFAPHALWLQAHGYQPVHYALDSSLAAHLAPGERIGRALHWLLDQLLNRAMPAWILLAIAARAGRKRPPDDPVASSNTGQDERVRHLLLIWAVVPLLFMPATSLITGADLKMHWGLPFLLFAVPACMELFPLKVRWARVPLRTVATGFVLLQFAMLIINACTSPRGPWCDRRQERAFDAAALAQRLQEPARRALNGRICVVSGPYVPTAALAFALEDRPKLLIDGRYDYSPWVLPELVRQCGLLEVDVGPPIGGWLPVGSPFERLRWRVRSPAGVSTVSP